MQIINGLMMKMDYDGADGPITIQYNSYEDGSKVGKPTTLEVDLVIGADGANSRVAKDIDAGEYDYAIAFQVGDMLLLSLFFSACVLIDQAVIIPTLPFCRSASAFLMTR